MEVEGIRQNLLKKLERVERAAKGTKFNRFLVHPWKYLLGVLHFRVIYQFFGKSWKTQSTTFFGQKMWFMLHSGLDIYLTGGKTHDSELRLTKYLIHAVVPDGVFFDVGAHIGYYSLLVGLLKRPKGAIYAFEASKNTYRVLEYNCHAAKMVFPIHKAVSDQNGRLTFYEFPTLFAEFNTLNKAAFKDQSWYKSHSGELTEVESVSLAHFCEQEKIFPNLIKVDVEGSELMVIKGLAGLFHQKIFPDIIMEVWGEASKNRDHLKAIALLQEVGYSCYSINAQGKLELINGPVQDYFDLQQIESDNLVFKH